MKQELDGCEASDSIKVEVGSTGLNETRNIGSLSIHPNPNNGVFTIGLQAKTAAQLHVKLYNALGTEVMNTTRDVSAGNNEINISASIAPGVYLLVIQEPIGIFTKKIIIKP